MKWIKLILEAYLVAFFTCGVLYITLNTVEYIGARIKCKVLEAEKGVKVKAVSKYFIC